MCATTSARSARGFAAALALRWPALRAAYRAWYRSGQGFALGAVQTVPVDEGLWAVNMIAQHGIRTAAGLRTAPGCAAATTAPPSATTPCASA
ncbi:hypothetical protein Ppa06_63330 [Planomonospora parontospora subsp. parontospora]|uniref:Uncharacterized protein n=2 Tax=Planomonospora parontospora TaxID=58119 RepID=A0AA37F8R2_9ACTN|nr:hypothetical protein [Planomonospora parontospora]GGL01210.1 hypothetical protein GCM10010126_70560 [Planomonospora parontospora]GII12535.1 hypothetical protein Ppa06_63330 [Planomonospora parontospora subsp. parontospora]